MSWQAEVDLIHREVCKAWPPYGEEDIRYLALAGEVGELLNLVKKQWRRSTTFPQIRGYLREELADCQIYLQLLANALGTPLEEAVAPKIPQLYRRWPAAKRAVDRMREEEGP